MSYFYLFFFVTHLPFNCLSLTNSKSSNIKILKIIIIFYGIIFFYFIFLFQTDSVPLKTVLPSLSFFFSNSCIAFFLSFPQDAMMPLCAGLAALSQI